MEFWLLRSFLTIVEMRHFGRAADALHLRQPALSKQIAVLEETLGARLFERGRHGVELTTLGEDFFADGQERSCTTPTPCSPAPAKPAAARAGFCASVCVCRCSRMCRS